MNALSRYFSLNTRYSRSINLERDASRSDLLAGYIFTQRARNTLHRISNHNAKLDANGAWTITSVYGTGKSAFCHFLSSLLASPKDPLREVALKILTQSSDLELYPLLHPDNFPVRGYIRALATGTREPVSHTIIRALSYGVEKFWQPHERERISAIKDLVDLRCRMETGEKINSRKISQLVGEIAQFSQSGIFIILDELGKNLEFSAYNSKLEDLYLLQEIVELSFNEKYPIHILGVLHQSFSDYSQRLGNIQRNEWSKIQGRFEDISFTESIGEMMRLISEAIDSSNANQVPEINSVLEEKSKQWFNVLSPMFAGEELSIEIIKKLLPLHPLVALVLPILCNRYAQNDRSLFTFLTGYENFSFRNFLNDISVENFHLQTFKLDQVYDYFVENVAFGMTTRPNFQRWVEIHELITDAKHLDQDSLKVLKTIGVLNLITITGNTRATKSLVQLALLDDPQDSQEGEYWANIINNLLSKGLITHFRQLDELRLWQGSDFNLDLALGHELEKQRESLVKMLSDIYPLTPLVAQRHSYQKGTLRYFERFYIESYDLFETIQCASSDSDGAIAYWLNEESLGSAPAQTIDQKPLMVIEVNNLEELRIATREFFALNLIFKNYPELQSDGVAKKEVRYRLGKAEELLDDIFKQTFDLSNGSHACWSLGEVKSFGHIREFNLELSNVCDLVYSKTPRIWNELINRRILTSQGTKARRDLVQAMVENFDQEKLGLQGYGPEVSMYFSLLKQTGIHRFEYDEWSFQPPARDSEIWTLWDAIESFCFNAKDEPVKVECLYQQLTAPPYGMKQGGIIIFLVAVLIHYANDIGIYQDGTFIPLLGIEHFEILTKDPSRFSVKNFEVVGLRSQVFKELETILRTAKEQKTDRLRNATLLSVVAPLYKFIKKLPTYTKQTKRISSEAQAVLNALISTPEPDELIFTMLPIACGLSPIRGDSEQDSEFPRLFKTKLSQLLREINTAYEQLLSDCRSLLYEAFGVHSDQQQLREDLQTRARYVAQNCIERTLKSFTKAALDDQKSDREWLESLIMIIGDKPAISWSDQDVVQFEVRLSELSRKFKNLEALQKDSANQRGNLETRRITVTRPDGNETHQLIWLDRNREEQVENIVNTILKIIPDDDQVRHSVLAKLTEKLLGNKDL